MENWVDEDYAGLIADAPTPTRIPTSLPSRPPDADGSATSYDSRRIFSPPTYSPSISHSDAPTPASQIRDPANLDVFDPPKPNIDIASPAFDYEGLYDEDLSDESPTLPDGSPLNDSCEDTLLPEEEIIGWEDWCVYDCEQTVLQDNIRCPLLLIFQRANL
eukprot:UN22515